MTGVGDDHRSRPPSVGGIDELSAIARIVDNSLDRSRLWRNDRHDSVRGDDVTKANIDELNLLVIHDESSQKILWVGDRELKFVAEETIANHGRKVSLDAIFYGR